MAILIHKCSLKYVDLNIVYYDLSGFSSIHPERLEEKKKRVLKELLPEFVVQDYMDNLHINEVLKYKLSRKVFAILYKIVLFYEKKKGYVLE